MVLRYGETCYTAITRPTPGIEGAVTHLGQKRAGLHKRVKLLESLTPHPLNVTSHTYIFGRETCAQCLGG